MRKILLLGSQGQIGWELERSLTTLGKVLALDRSTLDLANFDKMRAIIRELAPHVIVNATGYTAVDKAEKEPTLAMAINAEAPTLLAEIAKSLNAIFIHYSTDYVFGGEQAHPYRENDETRPLNVYGSSKLAGEKGIQSIGGNYFIFRTSWIYASRGKNFLLTMLKLAQEKPELKIVDDQIGAPTWSRLVAEATSQVLARCLEKETSSVPWGLYHMTTKGETSWYGFAKAILNRYQEQNADFKIPQLVGIPSSDYPVPAERPLYSVLSNQKLWDTFDISLPSWEKGLELCMNQT